jgi:hypothetical protein
MNATAGGLFCYIRDQQHIYSITLVIPQVNSLFSPFAVAVKTAASLRKFAARRRATPSTIRSMFVFLTS